MKLTAAFNRSRAATLVEFMVAMLLLSSAVVAILSTYLYGMRTTEFVKPKIMACDEARTIVSTMIDEIRAAKDIHIGNATANSFTEAVAPQIGNALLIYPGTNTNYFIRYFLDTTEKRLKRNTNGGTYVKILASDVTNKIPFTLEDIAGKTLTNRQSVVIVGLNLQFQKSALSTNSLQYDNYQISTKVTKRSY
jgi:hypothetical protein